MERNFETVMIEQCAPVLASLKPAGLFRYETRDCADLARRVKNWNEQLQTVDDVGVNRVLCHENNSFALKNEIYSIIAQPTPKEQTNVQ